MKQLLTALMLMMTLTISAQHLTIMGISIDGSKEEMADALVKKGFEKAKGGTGVSTVLKGIYAGEESTIVVQETCIAKKSYRVAVHRVERSTWKELITDYEMLFGILVEEYNTPIKRTEAFDEPYFEGDHKEMEAIKAGKCHYKAVFQGEGGKVIVAITKKCRVSIQFDDDVNCAINEQEKKEIRIR